jgi:hypothetical protein
MEAASVERGGSLRDNSGGQGPYLAVNHVDSIFIGKADGGACIDEVGEQSIALYGEAA